MFRSKRKFATDTEINTAAEVEARYTLQFNYMDATHNIHITFYYTRCSIWIQGSCSLVNNITIA